MQLQALQVVLFFRAYLTTLCGSLSLSTLWRKIYDSNNSYQLLLLFNDEGGLIMKPLKASDGPGAIARL